MRWDWCCTRSGMPRKPSRPTSAWASKRGISVDGIANEVDRLN